MIVRRVIGSSLRDGTVLQMEWTRSTFRDLQSSQDTLSGLDSLCLLRFPDASATSMSESSSPLHASSSPCSAALAGELSVSFWLAFIVVGAGEESPSRREIGLMFPGNRTTTPPHAPSSTGRAHTAEAPAVYGRTSSPPNNVLSVFDGWPAWW